MTSIILVWILIVGSGGRTAPAQLGPFAALEDCRRVAASSVLKNNESHCIQVNLIVGAPK